MTLLKYVLKRILISLITVFGVIIIAFFITRLLPGDPVWARLTWTATMEDYLQERERLGLDESLFTQFVIFLGDVFTGNWGRAYFFSKPWSIWVIVGQHLTRTLDMILISSLIAFFFGILIGKNSIVKQNGIRDKSLRILSYIFAAIPGFVVFLFFWQLYPDSPLEIFPAFGYKTAAYPDPPVITGLRSLDCLLSGKWYLLFDYIWHITVPISIMTIIQMSLIIRQTRGSFMEELQMDYVQLAKAKGLSNKKVFNKHVLKNALPPILTIATLQFPIFLGGLVTIEIIYETEGLGYLFIHAIASTDYMLTIAIIFVFSIIVIIFNFISDLLIIFIDPRIKIK